jgi:hypothetical protein
MNSTIADTIIIVEAMVPADRSIEYGSDRLYSMITTDSSSLVRPGRERARQ